MRVYCLRTCGRFQDRQVRKTAEDRTESDEAASLMLYQLLKSEFFIQERSRSEAAKYVDIKRTGELGAIMFAQMCQGQAVEDFRIRLLYSGTLPDVMIRNQFVTCFTR